MLVRIRGRSMLPLLRPGHVVWASPRSALKRGDIVVFRKPDLLVKRVVGLPGEKIDIRSGRVAIDNVPLPESYVPQAAYLEPLPDGSWKLGPDDFFVLGDTRDDSLDSRKFGPIRRQNVVGRVTRRLWPLGEFGKLLLPILCLCTAIYAQDLSSQTRVLAFVAYDQMGPAIGEFVPGRGWVQATDFYIAPAPGTTFSLFGVTGKLGDVSIDETRRPNPDDPPIAWSAYVARGKSAQENPYVLGIENSWPDTESPAQQLDLQDPQAVRIAAAFLKKHGVQTDAPYLTQAFKVDLLGDGQLETVLCAHSDLKALIDDKPGDIYAVALIHRDTPKEVTTEVASEISHKPAAQTVDEHRRYYGERDFYRFIAFHDIDGDGKREIVFYRAKADATQLDVFTYDGQRVRRVLSSYKANYQ